MSSGQNQATKRKRCPACEKEFTGTLVVCPHDQTLLMVVKESLVGTMLGKYHVMEEIGQGGMSIVYKGRHELMDRTVAIKMLNASLLHDQTSIKRFQQEAQAVACLSHPNVIAVYDTDITASGQPYIVMDYLVGESLTDVIRRENHISVDRAINIFTQAFDALEHAHQKGVIHRDLKSSNIMLIELEGKKDVVKVVDFGIAKLMPSSGKQSQNLTQTGEIFGSPIYMSPEQCQGLALDARSDIYSAGIMMYEALTGQPPLMGDTIVETMQMHVDKRPPAFNEVRPDLYIPPALEKVVLTALEKLPQNRYASMEDFRDHLQHAGRKIAGDPTQQQRPTPPSSVSKAIRSTKQKMDAGGKSPPSLPKPMLDTPDARESAVKMRSQSSAKLPAQEAGRANSSSDRYASFKPGDLRRLEEQKRRGKTLMIIGVSSVALILVVVLLVLLKTMGAH